MTTLQVTLSDGIGTVVLSRPAQLNAFDAAMMSELTDLWTRWVDEPRLRVVVVTGSGRGFSVGADIALLASDRAPGRPVEEELAFLPGRRLDVPVVAAVNGICAGGGLHFLADADLVVAAATAQFIDPHVSVGQVSGIEPVSLLPRIGFGAAARLSLLGGTERWSAAEALRVGLVDEVVADEALIERANQLAQRIAAQSPAAVRATRRVLRASVSAIIDAAVAEGWAAVQAHWAHPDSDEGPAAFSRGRKPQWLDGSAQQIGKDGG